MKVYYRFMAMLIGLLVALVGCNVASGSDPLADLHIPDTGYEQCFSPVESAVLYVDGAQQQINPDDPRLTRVLSFLGYAVENEQYVLMQGVIHEEKINQHYASGATMLEVTFAVDPEGSSYFCNAPKILICGDTYLLFMNPETYYTEELCAERHWPYAAQAPEGARGSNVDLSWGGEYWLDILAYCGF